MYADVSRDTFDTLNRYSRVLQQQGRLLLDADFNEQAEILLHQVRALAVDLIGAHGGPVSGCGFALRDALSDEVAGRLNLDAERRQQVEHALANGDLLIGPGRYYVGGLMAECTVPLLFSEQRGVLGGAESLHAARASDGLVLLDAWEREITVAEAPGLLDPALGTVDACARVQLVWQLRLVEGGASDDPESMARQRCGTGSGQLQARTRPGTDPASAGGYTGAENQLYRVEIQHGGGVGQAKWKWSRDNAVASWQVRAISGQEIQIAPSRLDETAPLQVGQWLELVDDATVFGDAPAQLCKVVRCNGDHVFVESARTLPEISSDLAEARYLRARRWDAACVSCVAEDDDGDPAWVPLDNGIEVRFSSAGIYRSGDYWLIPARPATGNIDWPEQRATSGPTSPASLAPRGPVHHVAPLARWGNNRLVDLRRQFRPLAG